MRTSCSPINCLPITVIGKTDLTLWNQRNLLPFNHNGTPSFFPDSTSLTTFPPPSLKWHRGMGNEDCSQFLTLCPFCFFFLTLLLYSSTWDNSHGIQPFTNFSTAGPPHRLQFKNCSSVGDFHGAQSFRNRLLPSRTPMRLQVPPDNLLLHGILSMGCNSWQEP